ncbi:MAG: hypothetical protein ACRDJU_06135 [Actinomycetota bacterium]
MHKLSRAQLQVVGGSGALLVLFIAIEAATKGALQALATVGVALLTAVVFLAALRSAIRMSNVNLAKTVAMLIVVGVLVLMRLAETFKHQLYLYGLIAGGVFAVGMVALEVPQWLSPKSRPRRDLGGPKGSPNGWHPPAPPLS